MWLLQLVCPIPGNFLLETPPLLSMNSINFCSNAESIVGVRLRTDHMIGLLLPTWKQQVQTSQLLPLSVPLTVQGIVDVPKPESNEDFLIDTIQQIIITCSTVLYF